MSRALGDVLLRAVKERHAERAGPLDELAGAPARMLGDREHRRIERDVHRRSRRARALRAVGRADDRDAVRDPSEHGAGERVVIASVFGHPARLAGMVEWSDNSRVARRRWDMRSGQGLLAIAISTVIVVGCGGGAGTPAA